METDTLKCGQHDEYTLAYNAVRLMENFMQYHGYDIEAELQLKPNTVADGRYTNPLKTITGEIRQYCIV